MAFLKFLYMRHLVNMQTNKNVIAFGSKSLCIKKLYLEENIMDVIAVTFMVKKSSRKKCIPMKNIPCNFGQF